MARSPCKWVATWYKHAPWKQNLEECLWMFCVFSSHMGWCVSKQPAWTWSKKNNRFAPAPLANPFKTACGWSDDPIWGIGCADKEPLSPHSQPGLDEPHAGDDGIVSVHPKPKLLSIAGLFSVGPIRFSWMSSYEVLDRVENLQRSMWKDLVVRRSGWNKRFLYEDPVVT